MVISEETVKYSLKNLNQDKFRSFLTILSIFIGITAIFIFISFGIGLYEYVNEFAGSSSADKITIMTKGTGAPGLDDTFALTQEDVDIIDKTAGVYESSAMYFKPAEIKQKKLTKYAFIIGYEPDKPIIFEVSNIDLYKGRKLRAGDKGKVVLGYNYLLPDKIFPEAYDINDKIEIQGQDFRIVGFYESVGNPQDDSQIYTTNSEMESLYGDDLKGYTMVMAEVDIKNINTIIERVEKNLRKSRNLEEGKEDFYVQSWQELLETYNNVLNGIVGFIIAIAFVSIIISAINTANTMITSVLERRKEIGIMKAVGAKNSEIFKQFLFESSVLGFIAGILGTALGATISYGIGYFLTIAGWSFLSPSFSWQLFVGLIAFATKAGGISGAIPAYRASKINPVEALRHE